MAPLDPARVRANLETVRAEVGPDVQILAATKYLPLEDIGALAQAGVTLAGENRAQDLEAKAAAHPELTWDFIGQLQSRKVKQVVAHVRYIHSVASDSALRELASAHGLRELSMGTTQDYAVAAQEGATIVRIGQRLYA